MAQVELTMPEVGESIVEGLVVEWLKQPGDTVDIDEPIMAVETDKADVEVPSTVAGVIKAILVPVDEMIQVGAVFALIETDVEAAQGAEAAPSPPAEEPAPSQEAAPIVEAPAAHAEAPAAPSEENLVEVVMPKMGESITEGTVVTWHKQPGDVIDLDETILEIGTDKVDTEVPSPVAGVLKEILVEEGVTVDVGTVVALIATEAAAVGAPTPRPATPQAVAALSGDGAHRPEVRAVAEADLSGAGTAMKPEVLVSVEVESGEIGRYGADGRFISPLVRSIAQAEGLTTRELETIPGSGRDGRLTKQDLLGYLKERSKPRMAAPPRKPAPPRPSKPVSAVADADYGARVEIIEMDRMRQLIAEHMRHSKQTSAHVTSFAEADVTHLVRLREAQKQLFMEREGVKLTYTPFFAYAAVEALREHPMLNASVEGNKIIIKKEYHVGIAVNLEKSGLIVPVIRHAGHMNIAGLAHAASDLAHRARTKQLEPDELQGGTFTVTNIGSLGSIMGTPIILQPQVAILATGAIKKRPMVIEDPELGDIIAVRHMMYLSLSYDHRIIDGAMGVSFLRKFVEVIESLDPAMEL